MKKKCKGISNFVISDTWGMCSNIWYARCFFAFDVVYNRICYVTIQKGKKKVRRRDFKFGQVAKQRDAWLK